MTKNYSKLFVAMLIAAVSMPCLAFRSEADSALIWKAIQAKRVAAATEAKAQSVMPEGQAAEAGKSGNARQQETLGASSNKAHVTE